MVRPATGADVAQIVAMGERFIRETRYRDQIAGDPAAMAQSVENLIASDTGTVLVADTADGALVGMLGGFVYVHPFSGERQACEAFWWVEPAHRGRITAIRLLMQFEQWARGQAATRLLMIAPTPDVERLYQRLGFVAVETTYQRGM